METVYFGEDKHVIETAPLTLVFNTSFKESFYPDRIMIDPEMTLDHFRRMEEINPYVAGFFKMVVPDFPEDIVMENLKNAAAGFQHLIGLFDLSLNMLLEKRKFGWRLPETYLHPKYQANLGDALITFAKPELFVKFITSIKESLLKGSA
jgi:hypothetical protein